MQTNHRLGISDRKSLISDSSINHGLTTLRNKYPRNVSIAYLNTNSVRNKFDQLKTYLNSTINVLMIAETKLDETFPDSQFKIEGMKSHID